MIIISETLWKPFSAERRYCEVEIVLLQAGACTVASIRLSEKLRY